VLPQYALAEGVDLAKGDGLHPRPFKPEAEPADARKQIEHFQAIGGRGEDCGSL
jgi:hypothetical protein